MLQKRVAKVYSSGMQVIKRGRYPKLHNKDPSVLALIQKLGIQLESTAAAAGVALVPIDTVKSLLLDKHKAGPSIHQQK